MHYFTHRLQLLFDVRVTVLGLRKSLFFVHSYGDLQENDQVSNCYPGFGIEPGLLSPGGLYQIH